MKPRLDLFEDIDLIRELVDRCNNRLDQPITSSLDRQLIRLLYDAGKLILRRVHRRHKV